MPPVPATTAQDLPVLLAEDFTVTLGANMGDPLSFAAELVLDDIYALASGARTARLSVLPCGAGIFRIAAQSQAGLPGAVLHLDAALSFMSPDGSLSEAFLMVEVDAACDVSAVYLLPLKRLLPRRDYQLVGIDTSTAHLRFAQSACVSFTRGTRITLATGAQRPVEGLRPGDRVLTRDDGVQPLRWIGRSTLRAEGDLAPIRIAAGTLNNVRDLLLSPGHGLFVYQRSDRLGVGRAEVLVRARDLVNGSTVVRSKGGFVDYFQLLFDRHQIIFAEGIAAESTLIDLHTSPALQGVMEGRIDDPPPFHDRARHTGAEIGAGLLDRRNAADLLRRASTG